MGYTVTIEQGESFDGSPVRPTYHISQGNEFDPTILDGDYYEDEFGKVHHRYADLDQARVHEIEDQAYYGTEDDEPSDDPIYEEQDIDVAELATDTSDTLVSFDGNTLSSDEYNDGLVNQLSSEGDSDLADVMALNGQCIRGEISPNEARRMMDAHYGPELSERLWQQANSYFLYFLD